MATATRKTAAPAAKKATPARSKPAEAEPDLLAGMSETPAAAATDDDDDFDLLSQLTGSDAAAWMPWDDEDQPDGIQGVITYVGTVAQDPKYGGDEVPYAELTDKDDPDRTWGIRGYGTVLRSQMEKANLTVGCFAAFKDLGEKEGKNNTYRNVICRQVCR